MSEVKQPTPAIGLSKEDLIQVLEAVRRPVKTDKEIQAEKQLAQERDSMRAIENQRQANKAANQNGCQHEHETGVGTPVVYIASLNRLYCQHCQLWIFQSVSEAAQNGSPVAPEKHPALWNRYYGKAAASGLA